MKLTFIHSRDYPSNKRANHREHTCNFQKLRTIGVILPNHRDYPCILLKFKDCISTNLYVNCEACKKE
ncbi:hypothetical protein Hanom_Chr15g01365101 [Helianthus anomalus]